MLAFDPLNHFFGCCQIPACNTCFCETLLLALSPILAHIALAYKISARCHSYMPLYPLLVPPLDGPYGFPYYFRKLPYRIDLFFHFHRRYYTPFDGVCPLILLTVNILPPLFYQRFIPNGNLARRHKGCNINCSLFNFRRIIRIITIRLSGIIGASSPKGAQHA